MNKNTLTVINKLQASHDGNNLELQKIISGRLKRLGRDRQLTIIPNAIYWPAEFFGLHQSTLFLQAGFEQQTEILSRCSQHLLQEAYFIEKSGLAYCAKMVLLAETTEAAQAYSLIGADEATHLHWVTPYIQPFSRTEPTGVFLDFLTALIEEGDANCLAYLLQVILEGWGLQHYRSLAADCLDPHLQTLFLDIIRDEALHQQTGTLLFQPQKLSVSQQNFLLDSLATFLDMVRRGPEAVVMQVESVLGHLNTQQKTQLLQQISAGSQIANKLKILQKLMHIPGCDYFIEQLDAKKMFVPHD
jgi:hypothetical protein